MYRQTRLWLSLFRTSKSSHLFRFLWSLHPFARCQEVTWKHPPRCMYISESHCLLNMTVIWLQVGHTLEVLSVIPSSSVIDLCFPSVVRFASPVKEVHVRQLWQWLPVQSSGLGKVRTQYCVQLCLTVVNCFAVLPRNISLRWLPVQSSFPHPKWGKCAASSAGLLLFCLESGELTFQIHHNHIAIRDCWGEKFGVIMQISYLKSANKELK